MRLAQTQVWPALWYFEAISPFTTIRHNGGRPQLGLSLPPFLMSVVWTADNARSLRSGRAQIQPVDYVVVAMLVG